MNTKGFISYLEGINHTSKTIYKELKSVEQFFAKVKKEDLQVTKPDVLKFLEYLKNKKGLQNTTRRHFLTAINHYFTFLLQNSEISTNPCNFLKIRGQKRKTLYKTYSAEELETLFDNYCHFFVRNVDYSRYRCRQQIEISALSRERNVLILSILTNQGVTTGEIEKIEIGDVNLIKATIKIKGGLHSNERTISLNATQIGLFMHYLQNIRPQLLEYQTKESEKLFLLLPRGSNPKVYNETLNNVFFKITTQLQSIDKQFINFKQVRASVITFWLKTQGLRKAQYLAGHRYVSSTESYKQNNLDNLIDDINKMHPFL
jgi:site-specific recombinase XerD